MSDDAVPGGVDIGQPGPHMLVDSTAPRGPVVAPALTKSSVSGRTPTDTSTRSAKRANVWSPLSVPSTTSRPGAPTGARATLRTVVEVGTCTP